MSSSGFLRALDDLDHEEKKEKISDSDNKIEEVNDQSFAPASDANNIEDYSTKEGEEIKTSELEEEEKQKELGSIRWHKLKAIRDENRQLERENQELYNLVKTAVAKYKNSEHESLLYYGDNAIATLQNAEESYKASLQHGTADDIAAATANYNFALNEYREAEKKVNDYKKSLTKPVNEQSQIYYDERSEQDYKTSLQRQWLRENPEIDRNSRYYNPKLEQVVIDEAEKLNQYLADEGATHLIGSREYLDKLEEYVEYYKNEASSNLRGYGIGTRNKDAVNNRVSLTPIEANIAASLNMTPAEYKAAQGRMPENLRTKQQMLRR